MPELADYCFVIKITPVGFVVALTSLLACLTARAGDADRPISNAPPQRADSSAPALAKPTPDQLAFMELEFGAFFHYGLSTYAGNQSRNGTAPPVEFDPPALDVDQWVRAARAMGARYAVLTARHEDGFCLWPTATTDYSLKGSP